MEIDQEPVDPQSSTLQFIESVVAEINAERADIAGWFHGYAAGHKARLALDLEMLRANVPIESSVLECGSIPLILTGALKKTGYRITGIDIAPERFESAIVRLGLDVRKCDIERERLPFETSSFDAVIFNELFEHLRIDLIFTMREVLRVLKAGGVLLLSTPNLRSLDGIINFIVRKRGYSCDGEVYAQYEKLVKLGHMGHVREYTSHEVAEFLGKVGFDVEKLTFRGKPDSYLPQLIMRLVPTLRPFVTVTARKPARHLPPAEKTDMLNAATQRCPTELLRGHLPPPCRLLQVGLGSGGTLARLIAAGYAATGITPDAAQVARARARHGDALPAVCARLEDFTGGAGAWDALLFRQSAQDIAPLDLFTQADKLLTERGEIIVLDEFALRRSTPGPEDLHLLQHFLALAGRFGFAVAERLDLSQRKDPGSPCGYFMLKLRRLTRPRWRVGRIDGGNAAAMRALFAETFKHPMSEAHWHWKYGAGRGHAVGVWREGRLVAHYGGTVRDMLMDGEPVRASQMCDVMVDTAHRGILSRSGPLFLAAATFVEAYLGYGRPCLLAFGFPNERAWKTPQRLGIYGRATGRVVEASWACRRSRPRLASMVRPLDLAAPEQAAAADALWAAMARELRAAIIGVRDAAWLRFRYIEHPDYDYRLFAVWRRLTNDLLGIFVIRAHEEAWELIDLIAPPSRLPLLVLQGRRLAAAAGVSRLYAWVSDAILPHLGADTQVKELSVIIPANAWTDGPAPEKLTGRWWLMGGDSDFR